ncbi:MAG: GNAT family N-acetyltransferase [Pikeienuella sp.]
MTEARIRRAGAEEDWTAIRALVAEAFAFMAGRIDPPSSIHRWTPGIFREEAGAGAAFLAHRGGRLIGCVFTRPEGDALHLGKLAVAGDQRGRGIARALVEAAAEEALGRGLAHLRLQTRIELVENHAAFAAMGFLKTGEEAHPGLSRPTSITMTRALGG